MSTRQAPGAGFPGKRPGWALWWGLAWLTAAALGYAAWQLFGHTPYRIDIDVYQMGARAWMDGRPLYRGDVLFHTPIVDLPFTYPPLAAIVFCPFAWMHMPTASVAITALTLVLLVVSTVIVLARLDVWSTSALLPGPAWLRRWWLAVVVAAAATIWLEPISSNFAFGQINVVLMTLVIADCLPRRTPWPRGLLLGLGMALKLTPAVFLLYFLLRRDHRAVLTALASFAGATLLGFVLAYTDSWEYWTHTVHHTDRIGSASLNTDQNIAGALARLGLAQQPRSLLWVAASLLVLSVVGVALMRWTPIDLLPKHHEASAVWWRQLAGMSYVWWALAVIVAAGVTVTARAASRDAAPQQLTPVTAIG